MKTVSFTNDRPFTKAEVKSIVVLFTVAIAISLAIQYASTGTLLSK